LRLCDDSPEGNFPWKTLLWEFDVWNLPGEKDVYDYEIPFLGSHSDSKARAFLTTQNVMVLKNGRWTLDIEDEMLKLRSRGMANTCVGVQKINHC